MSVPFRHRKLGYVALNVTDIENSITFYRDTVGLDLTASADQTAFFRCSQDHHNVILYEAEKPGLKRIGWEVENVENLELAQKHFAALGLETKDVDENELSVLCQGRSFRVREPNTKLTFEYYGNIQQSPKEFQPRAAKIARLGHVAVCTKDFSATLNFVTQKMNFRVSDTFGDVLAFFVAFLIPITIPTHWVGHRKTVSITSISWSPTFTMSDAPSIGCTMPTSRSSSGQVTTQFPEA